MLKRNVPLGLYSAPPRPGMLVPVQPQPAVTWLWANAAEVIKGIVRLHTRTPSSPGLERDFVIRIHTPQFISLQNRRMPITPKRLHGEEQMNPIRNPNVNGLHYWKCIWEIMLPYEDFGDFFCGSSVAGSTYRRNASAPGERVIFLLLTT
jgi:hypothetical protein